MNKKDIFIEFSKLSKNEKSNLTLKWLTDLVKTEKLSIEDIIDILNAVDTSCSKADKLNTLLINGTISASAVYRILGYGYSKSMNYINNLLKRNVIVKLDSCYKIIVYSLWRKRGNGDIPIKLIFLNLHCNFFVCNCIVYHGQRRYLKMNNTGCGCQSYGGSYNNGFLVILILFILLAILGSYFF